jgi:suppressor of cytokine signaling 5
MFTQPSKHRAAGSKGDQGLKSTITRLKKRLRRSRSRSENTATTTPTATPAPTVDDIASFQANLKVEIAKTPWYHESIDGREAKRILEGFPDGSFLLRNSAHSRDQFTVTYKAAGEFGSIRIDQDPNGLFTLDMTDPLQVRRPSPVALLEYIVHNQQALQLELLQGSAASVVYLQYPVVRVKRILSLQELCQQSIRSSLSGDYAIQSLPLPNSLKTAVQAQTDNEQYHFKLLEGEQ